MKTADLCIRTRWCVKQRPPPSCRFYTPLLVKLMYSSLAICSCRTRCCRAWTPSPHQPKSMCTDQERYYKNQLRPKEAFLKDRDLVAEPTCPKRPRLRENDDGSHHPKNPSPNTTRTSSCSNPQLITKTPSRLDPPTCKTFWLHPVNVNEPWALPPWEPWLHVPGCLSNTEQYPWIRLKRHVTVTKHYRTTVLDQLLPRPLVQIQQP